MQTALHALYTEKREEQVSAWGEKKLIDTIRQWLDKRNLPYPCGIGDDCAVLENPVDGKMLMTTDSVIAEQHFSIETDDAYLVGEKLIKRNISDIAAMGGKPHHALLNLILSPNVSTAWLKRFFEGLTACCKTYSIFIVGGDVTSAPHSFFGATLTLIGSAKKPLLRRGGKIGDYIAVTGALGGSLLGKHLTFTPRLTEGQWLSEQPTTRALMDLSDGLAEDLPQMLPEHSYAHINATAIPISKEAHTLILTTKQEPLFHALNDGEDYELLIILDSKTDWNTFQCSWHEQFKTPLHLIGTIAAQNNASDHRLRFFKNNEEWLPSFPLKGYVHFPIQ